jgi:hypothetical protein
LAGNIDQAVELVAPASNYSYYGASHYYSKVSRAEKLVFNALKLGEVAANAALEHFAAVRENESGDHGYWVHALSHFDGDLWRRGLKDWVKRLYGIAFIGATELKDPNCSPRLLGNFLRFAPQDAVLADYGISQENLQWTLLKRDEVPSGDYNQESSASMAKVIFGFPYASKEEWETVTKGWRGE